MRIIFRGAACLTLLIDAYLLLAMVAIPRMKSQYHHLLPPFDNEFAASMPRSLYLGLIGWTGLLALGCLYTTKHRDPQDN